MRIKPIRVLFKRDSENDNEGRPTESRIEMEPVDDQGNECVYFDTKEDSYCCHYETVTHDRGNKADGQYYQLAFQVDDIQSNEKDDLELRYDVSYRDDDFMPPTLSFDDEAKLWYQKTKYKKKNNENNKEEYELYYNSKYKKVDSITTAGVFRVVMVNKRTGEPVEEEGNPSPWIYVLPSSATIAQYKAMITELMDFNRRLVVRDKAVTGLGSEELDSKDLKELVPCIRQIMRQPSELMQKRYEKVNANKLRSFDAKVIRDYAKTGGSGRIANASYQGDNNTYENQVIKVLLSNIVSEFKQKYQSNDTVISDIDKEMNVVRNQLSPYLSKYYTELITTTDNYSFTDSGYRPSEYTNYKMKITIRPDAYNNKIYISTDAGFQSHRFLCREGRLYGLRLETDNLRNVLFFLSKIGDYYERAACCTQDETLIICGTMIKDQTDYFKYKSHDVYHMVFSYIQSFDGEEYQNGEEITLAQYFKHIEDICNKYSKFIDFEDSHYNNLKDLEGQQKDLEDKRKKAVLKQGIVDKLDNIEALLNTRWFSEVAAYGKRIQNIRKTPKFLQNTYYSKAYKILTQLIKRHPYLTGKYDNNAFGINDTQRIYEYWVFHKLMVTLQSLGFVLSEKGIDSIRSHFDSFLGTGKIPREMNYHIELEKETPNGKLRIMVGYDVKLQGNGHERRPDYYLKIMKGKTAYWYFMDAKYKTLVTDNKKGENLYQLIYDISIAEYIDEMQTYIIPGDNNRIAGSYLIVSDIRETCGIIDKNGRLFGGKESIIAKDVDEYDEKNKSVRKVARGDDSNKPIHLKGVDNENGMPNHRYGAIKLTPENDNELKTLILLIFEYLQKTGATERDALLDICWECGSANLNRVESLTVGGCKKYYVTCNNCKSFRVENHCANRQCLKAIIKHSKHNYHIHDPETRNNKWAFICPCCGRGVAWMNNNAGNLDNYQDDGYISTQEEPIRQNWGWG